MNVNQAMTLVGISFAFGLMSIITLMIIYSSKIYPNFNLWIDSNRNLILIGIVIILGICIIIVNRLNPKATQQKNQEVKG